MFAALDCTRDWPTLGMTTRRWLSVPTTTVALDDLIATQDGVYLAPLIDQATPLGRDPIPHVIAWRGRLHLEDGHHRAVRAALRGQRAMTVRVLAVGG